MGIEAISLGWALGALWLVGVVVAGGVAAWSSHSRVRAARRARVDALVRGLCELNAQVAVDNELASLLIEFVERPERLDRIGRVRARAWFDAARRLHRLLHEALEASPSGEISRSMWAPSMGEAASASRSPGAPDPGSAAPGTSPAFSNLTLIDPEFQAWIEALRETRSAETPVSAHR